MFSTWYHFKLSSKQYPTNKKDKEEMKKILYISTVGILIYSMICIRLDIANAIDIVSQFFSNLSKKYWAAIK